jgi:hypothetical protein
VRTTGIWNNHRHVRSKSKSWKETLWKRYRSKKTKWPSNTPVNNKVHIFFAIIVLLSDLLWNLDCYNLWNLNYRRNKSERQSQYGLEKIAKAVLCYLEKIAKAVLCYLEKIVKAVLCYLEKIAKPSYVS